MKVYNIYVKSHCHAPDIEDWCWATSKKQAVTHFTRWLGNEWEDADLRKDVNEECEVKKCGKCSNWETPFIYGGCLYCNLRKAGMKNPDKITMEREAK